MREATVKLILLGLALAAYLIVAVVRDGLSVNVFGACTDTNL